MYLLDQNMESAGAIAPGSPSISEKLRNDQKPVFHFMKDGDIFDLGDKKLVVYEMTGHTACLLYTSPSPRDCS